MRVKELWAHLSEQSLAKKSIVGFPPITTNDEPESFCWDEESLWVARALADGKVQIVVERSKVELPEAYAARLSRLGKHFPMVFFVPEDQSSFDSGTAFWRKAAEHQVEQIRVMPVNVVQDSRPNSRRFLWFTKRSFAGSSNPPLR